MAGLDQFSDLFKNPLLTQAISEVPVKKEYIGSRFLPVEETYDLDWNETVLTRQEDMANLVDAGAELPLTDRDPLRTVSGSIVNMGQAYIVTPKELMALMDKGNAQKRALAEKQILKKLAIIKGNIDARMEWMRWQALGTGALAYNKGGVILGVDFDVPSGNKVAAATKWNAATPAILNDYESYVQDYVDLNGELPDVAVTSLLCVRTMLSDPTMRKAVTGLEEKIITMDELNAFLVGRQMPKLQVMDTSVTTRDPNTGGTRTAQRLLDNKKLVFLKEGGAIGTQRLGPTLQKQMNPGVFVDTYELKAPTRQVVEVGAASAPKIDNPDLIYIATVLA